MSDVADRPVDAALRYAKAGFLIHPLDDQTRPFKGFQDSSTRDPEEIRRQFADPRAAGVGYLLGNGVFRAKDGLDVFCDFDLIAIDIDDGQEGLDQLARLSGEIGGVNSEFQAELPPTLTIATPSGNQQMVYAIPSDIADKLIGCRLNTSLELKAASKDGRPISGRLPPTTRAPKGDKPGGAYTFRHRMMPEWLRLGWLVHFTGLADGIRAREREVPDRPPPELVGEYERSQALKALKAACRKIAATRVGRFTVINNESLKIGHYAWALDQQEARNQLAAAARSSGWQGDIAKTVRTAFADGAAEPRDVRRSSLHAGRRRTTVDEPIVFGERS